MNNNRSIDLYHWLTQIDTVENNSLLGTLITRDMKKKTSSVLDTEGLNFVTRIQRMHHRVYETKYKASKWGLLVTFSSLAASAPAAIGESCHWRATFRILFTAQFLAGSHHSLSFVFAQFISVVESGEFCLRPSSTRIPESCTMVACCHSVDLAGTSWVWLSSWSGQVLWLLSCFSQWILLGYSVLTKTLNWKVSNNPS